MANPPNLHIFGQWEETGAPGGNLHGHGENVKTPHRQSAEAGIKPRSLALCGSHANHVPITEASTINILQVTIDQKLNWTHHI
eukprot:g43250.t1